jgi:hypothetical protein
MPCFVDVEKRDHGETLHVLSEQPCNSHDIFFPHFPQSRKRRRGWYLIYANHSRKCHAPGHETEFCVDQFWDVQETMIVPADSDGAGDDDSCGIYSLKDPFEMTLTGHFLN